LVDITVLTSLALSSLSVLGLYISSTRKELRNIFLLPFRPSRSLLYDGVALNAFFRISLALSVGDLDAHSPLGEDEIALNPHFTVVTRQLHGLERPFCLLDVIGPWYLHEWFTKSNCNIRADRSMALYCCICMLTHERLYYASKMRQNAGPTDLGILAGGLSGEAFRDDQLPL
jgi:hypothetical protein